MVHAEETERPPAARGRRRALIWLVLREAAVSFQRHAHGDTAALLAYYGFLSFIPLVLLISILTSQLVIMSESARESVRRTADELMAGLGAVALDQIQTLSQQRVWGLVGLLILFWSVTPFAAGLRGAMQRVFLPERPAGLLRAKLKDILGAVALVAVFLLLVLGRVLYGAIIRRLPGQVPAMVGVLQVVFSFGLALVALLSLFWVFAPVRLRPPELLSGAAVSAALLLAIRPAFATFLRYNPNYGWAFGSMKAVFLTLTWVYVSFAALLFGAEIMAAARRRDVALLRLFLAGGTGASSASPALVERHLRRVRAGDVLFAEGDRGDEMYVVRSGSVAMRRGDHLLRVMREGEYFGELSMLLGSPRSATAEALEDGEVVVIRRDHFDTMLREQPEMALPLLRELAERLRATDAKIGASNVGPVPEDEISSAAGTTDERAEVVS